MQIASTWIARNTWPASITTVRLASGVHHTCHSPEASEPRAAAVELHMIGSHEAKSSAKKKRIEDQQHSLKLQHGKLRGGQGSGSDVEHA